MTNKKLTSNIEKSLLMEIERLNTIGAKTNDEDQKKFLEGFVQGIRQSILKLPLCFDESGNVC